MKYEWDLDKIKDAVSNSINLSEVLAKLDIPRKGNNSSTLKKIMEKNNIDYSHFTGRARTYKPAKKVNIENYLHNEVKVSTHLLKKILYQEGYKENKCEICGINEWNGKPIVCQLHHINGNHYDNRLENLQMLCPNCHSQTDNYCGSSNKKEKVKKYCPDCGKPINMYSNKCPLCSAKSRRRVQRPSREILLQELENSNYTELGKKYGVTDNAIRKWLKP